MQHSDHCPVEVSISCICITHNRVQFLRRAISCFEAQTVGAIELIIVYLASDGATADYLSGLRNPRVRAVAVDRTSRPPLGELRNIGIDHARGEYVATWDDDDWYASTRLEEQMAALRAYGKSACLLLNWILFDCLTSQAYLPYPRLCEGTMLCKKSVLPRFPGLDKGEDTAAISLLYSKGEIQALDRPELYVYVIHGSNTWNRAHFEQNLIRHATLLSSQRTAQIIEHLNAHLRSERLDA